MYKISKEFRFEAAHQLSQHDGKCKDLHGHSWRLVVVLECKTLTPDGPKKGMLIDYGDISAIVGTFIEKNLDHKFLNESLAGVYPTSENIAAYCYHYLRSLFSGALTEVRISETENTWASYRP